MSLARTRDQRVSTLLHCPCHETLTATLLLLHLA